MYMGDDFSRDESINGLGHYTPDQEELLDQIADDLNNERAEMLDHDAGIQMLEHMIESGILQPQDL